MVKLLKAINNFFSIKHDLLAIGLFTGASIALMLSELFNWFLNGLVSKAIPETSGWFAVISFFLLFLKFFCIAFVLFDIDWLYNKFARKGVKQKTSSTKQEMFVQQEVGKTIALEDLKESKLQSKSQSKSQLKERLKAQLKKDQSSQLESRHFETKIAPMQSSESNSEGNPKSRFIVEYLKGHDDELPSELEIISVDSAKLDASKGQRELGQVKPKRLAVKYQRQNQLRSELEKLIATEDITGANSVELTQTKIRSVLAKH